jgi:hypothetical protein
LQPAVAGLDHRRLDLDERALVEVAVDQGGHAAAEGKVAVPFACAQEAEEGVLGVGVFVLEQARLILREDADLPAQCVKRSNNPAASLRI